MFIHADPSWLPAAKTLTDLLAFCEFSFGADIIIILAFCEFSFGADIIIITDPPGVQVAILKVFFGKYFTSIFRRFQQ